MEIHISKYLRLLFIFSSILFISCNADDEIIVDDEIVDNDEQTQIETNINWKNWYLSVPINNGEGKATSIYYEDIEANNLSSEVSEYFYQNADSSYTLFTKYTGFTTSGEYDLNQGKFCRTELREFWQGVQSTKDNWVMSSGTHLLESTLKVDYSDGNNSIIVAQIHGKETEDIPGNPATVKVFWSNGAIKVFHYTKPAEDEPWTNSYENKNINAGNVGYDVFTIKLKIENGKLYYGLSCKEKGINIDYTFAYDYVLNGYVNYNYFKTGNYFINCNDYTETAQVKLYKIITKHF